MVFRSQGLPHGGLVEHSSSPLSRWLRARRLKIALWIAAIEGLLVVLHAIPKFAALAIAAAVILFYFAFGREVRSDAARQVSWIAAASQSLMVLVPVLVIVIGGLAVFAVVALAVVALMILLADRR
jgi:hypothetical protein